MKTKPVYTLKEETKKRCEIFQITEKTKAQYHSITLEQLQLLFSAPTLSFSIFFRFDNTMVEYIKPSEFSLTYLKELWQVIHRGSYDASVYIEKKFQNSFERTIETIREKKIHQLKQQYPQLNDKVVNVYENLSKTSQLIVKGGINNQLVTSVRNSAALLIANQLNADSTLETMQRMINCDPTLYDHSASVAMLAGIICSTVLNKTLGAKEIQLVTQAALYHDVGKTCIPSHILNKPDKLNDEEFDIMKQHALLGSNELKSSSQNGATIEPEMVIVAQEHHEKFSGGGYPYNKKGRLEDDPQYGIHLFARIISIADVYSALLMKRIYKPAYDPLEASKIMVNIHENFDPVLFKPFIKMVLSSLQAAEAQRGRIFVFDHQGNLVESRFKKVV